MKWNDKYTLVVMIAVLFSMIAALTMLFTALTNLSFGQSILFAIIVAFLVLANFRNG